VAFLRRLGWMLARLVALAVLLLSAWIFVANVASTLVEQRYDETWILAWVLMAGLAGAAGGAIYLLSIDGPARFHTRSWRLWSWGAMLASALLPHSFTFVVFPAVLALLPTISFLNGDQKEAVTSS
jgi:hypothetical protein